MKQIGQEELLRAARTLVRTCLEIAPGDRFVIVGDAGTQPILTALEAAGVEAGGEVSALRLDLLRSTSTNHSGERPHKVLPDAIRRAMLSAQASVFVASAPHAESSMRDQLTHVVGACKGRHAHMPGITPLAFVAGLSIDYATIRESGRDLERYLDTAHEIVAESAQGTRLTAKLSPTRRWFARLGVVGTGESVAIPAGSFVTSPETISGTFAATASVGEYFGAREGLLSEAVIFELVDGRVMNVLAPGAPQLARDIANLLHVAPNSDRVGLVVLGINAGIETPTGDVSVDQHRPGLHLVFGDPLGKLTGATWSARTSFAACQTGGSVRIDGALIADDGALTFARTDA